MVVFVSDSQDIFARHSLDLVALHKEITSKVRLSISGVVHSNQDGVSTFDMFDVLKTHLLGLFLNNMPLKQLQNFVCIIKFSCFVHSFWKFDLIANYNEV